MRRFVLLLLSTIVASITYAQTTEGMVLVGDMDSDGSLTINDVRILTDVVLGKEKKRYVTAEYIRVTIGPGAEPPAKQETKRHYKGDVDDDGKLSVVDIAALTGMLNGDAPIYIAPDVVYDTLGVKNGYEYVDLGLSVKWATRNVGAATPDGAGEYFAWAETTPKPDYSWGTYKWMTSGRSAWNYVNKYTINDYQYSGVWYDDSNRFVGDGKSEIEINDDAANYTWGEDWRTPSFNEWYDLKTKCTWKWTSNHNESGISGYIVTSKVAGYTDKSIFLPVTGYQNGKVVRNTTTNGVYWTRDISSPASDNAYGLGFNSSSNYWFDQARFYGLTIRPVRP